MREEKQLLLDEVKGQIEAVLFICDHALRQT